MLESELLTLPNVRVIFEVGCDDLSMTAPDLRKAYPDSAYYAFDPDPRHSDRVKATRADEVLNVKFYPIALSDKPGLADFYMSTEGKEWIDDWSYSSSLNRPTVFHPSSSRISFNDQCVTVNCETLDNFCSQNGIKFIDLLHIDVQSAEKNVLLGAVNMIPNVHFIFMEVNTGGVYVGETSLEERMKLLPGWKLVKHYPYDALLENMNFVL